MDKAKEQAKLGRFNIKVTLHYLNGEVEEGRYKQWLHSGNTLALDTYDNSFRVINILSLKSFIVSMPDSDAPLIQ